MKLNNSWYSGIGFLTSIIVFILVWIYALLAWGLLLGLIFGWIPALIGGFISYFIWPLLLFVAIWLYSIIFPHTQQPYREYSVPTLTYQQIAPSSNLLPSPSPTPDMRVDCIGPDGKHLSITFQECVNFNNAWGSVPKIDWSPNMETAFMQDCTMKSITSFCQCALTYVKSKYSLYWYVTISRQDNGNRIWSEVQNYCY